jgi:hypothetical protein
MTNSSSGGIGLRGQKLTEDSLPVTMASDQPTIDVAIEGDSPSGDAAGRLRTADPLTIFDHYFTQDSGALFWDTDLTGSATVAKDANGNYMNLSTTTASGDRAIHQTKPYFSHQAGKSHEVLFTGVMGATKTDVRKRIGYFDANNGLFFEDNGTTLRVVRRSNVSGSIVDSAVDQASWNLDTLDGNGNSGLTLDMDQVQLFTIDFEWLGAGRVRFGFNINGVTIYCHEYLTSNVLDDPFMNTPNLPIRYEIENLGVIGESTTMKQVCCTVISEGGWNPLGVIRNVDSTSTTSTVTGEGPLLSVRLKPANNRAIIIPSGVSAAVTNGKAIIWRLYHGTSLTGASWTDVSSTSFSQVDNSATAFSGGEQIASGHVSAGASTQTFDIETSLWIASDIAGTSDILTLTVERIDTGGGASTVASISYKEFL